MEPITLFALIFAIVALTSTTLFERGAAEEEKRYKPQPKPLEGKKSGKTLIVYLEDDEPTASSQDPKTEK